MAGTFRGNHEYINVCRRNDLLEMDVEAMGKCQGIAGFQVRSNLVLVNIRLFFIRNQDHDDVSPFRCFAYRYNFQTGCFRFGRRFGAFVQTDFNCNPAVAQVQRMGMSLAAITDDGNLTVFNDIPVYVLIIENFCHGNLSFFN